MSSYHFNEIALVHSCYKEKFGIPRQPGLVLAQARIEMHTEYSDDEAFRELEQFSHIWVTFVFHAIEEKKWKSTVRPPRLGGNQRVGVFASRSMFRPNPLGLSVVELKSIERKDNKIILNIVGGDFLDKTPVIDIKPYISFSDSIPQASSGYAQAPPNALFDVVFSSQAEKQIEKYKTKYEDLEKVIVEILQLDPRPAYKKEKAHKNNFAIKLYEFDVLWQVDNNEIRVSEIIDLGNRNY